MSVNNGDGTFQPPILVLPDFGYDAGDWRIDKHLRFAVDLNNTGRVDLIAFGDAGVLISTNESSGQTPKFSNAKVALYDFGYRQGWCMDCHLRFLADINGNRLLDIVGFGKGIFDPPMRALEGSDSMCRARGGWDINLHPRFIAPMTKTGLPDLIGFADNGVRIAFNRGNGTFDPPKLVLSSLGRGAGGWSTEKHPRFVADLTGNQMGDLIGFGEDAVWVSLNNGDRTFQPIKNVLGRDFCCASGWAVEKHPRFLVDLTGNGCADIIGIGEGKAYAAFNDGTGNFGPLQMLIEALGSSIGWTMDRTVRYVANMR
ncbi:hypothetical protein BJ165DRAFT_1615854 [Panaeolus papilionaceus]|nr:hypothetical protein BJ165DRAFT_1615854 [Panaeolus papilionaceus]